MKNVNIINENVKTFEEGKKYIFSQNKIIMKEIHKWINHIHDYNVSVQLEGLGFIIVNHPRYGFKQYPITPKHCLEVL